MIKVIRLLIFFLIVSLGLKANAQPIVILDNKSSSISINKQIQLLEESNKQFSFEEISSGKLDSLFGENKYDPKNPIGRKRSFWMKAVVLTNDNENSEWYIKLWNYYSNVVCYIVQDGKIIKQKTGWELQLKDRSEKKGELLFKFTLNSEAPANIYLHVTTDPKWANPPEVRTEIIPAGKWEILERTHWIVIGLFSGILILTTSFWFANYLAGRRLMFMLALTLSNLFILLYFADKNNLFSGFLFSSDPWFTISHFCSLYIWYPFLILSIGFLFVSFRALKSNIPRISRYYIAFTCFIFLWVIIIPALSLSEYLNGVTNFIMICWLFYPLISWSFIWKKFNNQIGKIGLMDYSAIGIGWIVECLRNAFILPDTPVIRNLFPVGAALTVTIALFTFLSFVRNLRKKKNIAQKEKEELIEKQNLILEQKIEERTRELQAAQSELARQEKLAALGKLISNIAHEIQNPLNFVNNFSELAKEITAEIGKAKTDEERNELIFQLEENVSKINEHGIRADNIIKKMFKYLREGKGEELFDNFGNSLL